MSVEEDTLKKLRLRQARQLRVARAEGLLQGVLSLLRRGDIVVDCGANRGDITAALAETGAETHEHKFRALRPRLSALRETFAATYPPRRVNLDWI